MTNLMFSLRRSPRTLLERDGHPGPGAGHLALVMARAGVGKTAFLVSIGIDALLSGQKVLHVSLERSVDKVRDWYDDLLMEMLKHERQTQHMAALQVEMERRRHIQTYVGQSFSVDRLRQGLEVIGQSMDFVPQVIILDRMELAELDNDTIAGVVEVAREVGAELWMACRTHRDVPAAKGHLPTPADRFEELVDLAFRLDPYDAKIRLHVVKDRQQMLNEDLNVLLDPQTLLLMSGVAARK